MILYEDTLQQADKHSAKHGWWAAHGVELVRRRFDGRHEPCPSFGDYWREGSNVAVDTKASVDELARNISGGRKKRRDGERAPRSEHARFRDECERAAAAGYRLVVLVENDLGYADASDLLRWTNGHCAKCREFAAGRCMPMQDGGKCAAHGTNKPIQGARLYKALGTMHVRYGVRFEFCAPDESARRVCELLGVPYERAV